MIRRNYFKAYLAAILLSASMGTSHAAPNVGLQLATNSNSHQIPSSSYFQADNHVASAAPVDLSEPTIPAGILLTALAGFTCFGLAVAACLTLQKRRSHQPVSIF